MVATLGCRLDTIGSNGNPGLTTDIDILGSPNLRYKTNDNPTIDSLDTVPIPTSSVNNSYWKSVFILCEIAPDTQVDNFKIFTDGAGYGIGITLNVGDQFPTHNSGSTAGYEVATGTVGQSGNDLATNHTGISSVSDLFTFTIGFSLTGPTISETLGVIDAVSETSDYILTQAVVGTTATPGAKVAETITFQYDEI